MLQCSCRSAYLQPADQPQAIRRGSVLSTVLLYVMTKSAVCSPQSAVRSLHIRGKLGGGGGRGVGVSIMTPSGLEGRGMGMGIGRKGGQGWG